MNAYELADDLEGWSDDFLSKQSRENVFKQHAEMLRQQADELNKVIPALVKANGIIENQKIIIAELEKELKRIKFAWNMAENEIG